MKTINMNSWCLSTPTSLSSLSPTSLLPLKTTRNQWPNPVAMTITIVQIAFLNYDSSLKETNSFSLKFLILSLGEKIYKMSLEHCHTMARKLSNIASVSGATILKRLSLAKYRTIWTLIMRIIAMDWNTKYINP